MESLSNANVSTSTRLLNNETSWCQLTKTDKVNNRAVSRGGSP